MQKKDPEGPFLYVKSYPRGPISGSRLFAGPDICGPSAQLYADRHKCDQDHDLDRDSRDRSLDAEGDVVEEAVPRRRRIKT